MKKILVAVVALVMTSAFAHDGEHKHMVTFEGFMDAGNASSFDISFSDEDANDTKDSNIALNYTYAINGAWMVGAKYRNTKTTSDNEVMTGVQAFYNLDGRTHDTCFVGLHYDMTNPSGDDNDSTSIGLEYGHRFSVGMWKGMHLQFSPSVSYAMVNTETATDDTQSTDLGWNWIKFDLLF